MTAISGPPFHHIPADKDFVYIAGSEIRAEPPCHLPSRHFPSGIRSFSLSIGQLTFGSFLLLLAVITATSMASVIAIRHIDATFAELQRLQDVGDLAEEIDRRMNELRLAARDFVTDPAARPDRVAQAATELSELLKKTRLELAPEQQDMIDGVDPAPCQLPRRHRAGLRPDCAPRSELLAALPPARASSRRRSARSPERSRRQNAVSARKTRSRRRLLAHDPVGAEQAAERMRGFTIDDPELREATECLCRCRHCRSPEPKARSPSSTRRCWAPKAGRSGG